MLILVCIIIQVSGLPDNSIASSVESKESSNNANSCIIGEDGSCAPQDKFDSNSNVVTPRDVFVLGDVHGNLFAMKQVLVKIGIIEEIRNLNDPCVWSNHLRENVEKEIWLIQVGDIVDRGHLALECWQCLESLQNSAPSHAKVFRMLGNHEIWWLEGHVHMAHPTADTPQNIQYIVNAIKRDVFNDKISGSVYFNTTGGDVLLTHAGVQGDFFPYFEKKLIKQAGVGYTNDDYYKVVNAASISSAINQAVKDSIKQCTSNGALCSFTDKIFKAGRDRGGSGFGGPFWSDFTSVLASYNQGKLVRANFTQVVGHTAAQCAKNDEFCIRNSDDGNIICVDGGLYMGSNSFLKITHEGVFTSYEYDEITKKWRWERQIKPN